jgi:hypothetical protein
MFPLGCSQKSRCSSVQNFLRNAIGAKLVAGVLASHLPGFDIPPIKIQRLAAAGAPWRNFAQACVHGILQQYDPPNT